VRKRKKDAQGMTPDLFEEARAGARRLPSEEGCARRHSGDRGAECGGRVAARRGRLRARRGAVPGRHHRQLRRLQGAEQAVAGHQRRRAALHHRPQRRRQDDDDGLITGKTRPDSGTAFFGSTIDLLRLTETEIAQIGIGRKFQKPTVFEQLSVFENLELALKTDKRVRASLCSG
jgi:urea transport system ATP-binding protein